MSQKTIFQLRTARPAGVEVARRTLDLGPLVLLLVLPFVLFGAETLGYRVFYHHDIQYYFFPYHKLVADIVAAGHLPLWNPYAFSGIPLLGDGQTAMFYPPSWLFLALPPIYALTLVVLLHFGVAGAGMFAYVRLLGMSRLAALIAALAFMFNGFLVSRVVHLSILAGAALVPLIFWSFERLLQRCSPARFAAAASVVAAQALAGHPQVPIYTAVGAGLYVLVLAMRRAIRERHWWSGVWPIVAVAAVYAGGYALAAIQLVPWIELARFSPRAAGASYEFVTFQSLKRFDWLLFLFPYAYGGPRASWLQSAPAWDLPVYLWERMAYVGLLPLALAMVGLGELWRRSPPPNSSSATAWTFERDRLWALAVVLVVMALIAAGSGTPFGRVVFVLPAIGKLRAYARAIVVACFAVTALAAYGVERLRRLTLSERPGIDPMPLIAAALLLVLTGGALLVANSVTPAAFASVEREPMYRVLLERGLQWQRPSAFVPLVLALASALVLWSARRGIHRLGASAMVGLVAVDLLGIALTFNPTTEPRVFQGVPPSVAFLRQDASLYRTASFVSDDRLPPRVAQAQLAISWAMPYHIQDINGFNSLQPRRYTDFLFGTEVGDVSYGFLSDARLLDPDNHLLTMLDVRYALVQRQSPVAQKLAAAASAAQGERTGDVEQRAAWQPVYVDDVVTIYQNPASFGRAYFVPEVAVVRDPGALLQIVKQPAWEPQRQALVEAGLSEEQARQLSHPAPAQVSVEQVSPNELRLRTDTDRERFLVVSEMWFPGWHAEVEGRELPIYRTNYLLRGLVVPAGAHTVRMYYRPASALLGASITLAAMLVMLGGVVLARARQR